MLHLRQATASDHDAVWAMFQAVVAGGDACVFEADMTREEALARWIATTPRPFQGRMIFCITPRVSVAKAP